MAENNVETTPEVDVEPTGNEDYIQAINDLKAKSVSRDEYDKLRGENKKLLDALVNGRQIELPEETPVDVNALRKDLFSIDCDLTNIDYVSKALALRDAIIDKGGEDPFLPVGGRITITAEMREKAENVANVLQECIDFAQGDSGIFTAELQRRTKDIMLPRRAR